MQHLGRFLIVTDICECLDFLVFLDKDNKLYSRLCLKAFVHDVKGFHSHCLKRVRHSIPGVLVSDPFYTGHLLNSCDFFNMNCFALNS